MVEVLYLSEQLKHGVFDVTFTKVSDGSTRVMRCTLRPDLIPAREPSANPKPVNEHVQVVYDLEAKGWRSFRLDSVNTYTGVHYE